MHIGAPTIREKNGAVEYSATVSRDDGASTLWYRVDAQYADFISDRADAFLVALLMPAMLRGEDIHIDGTISPKLYYNASTQLQHFLKEIRPSFKLIRILPSTISEADNDASAVAAGLSCGVDSYCAVADHFFEPVCKEYTLTHLLFNDVGSHGDGGTRLFKERLADVKKAAQKIGLPVIATQSNIDDYYPESHFGMTNTLRDMSVASMLQKGVRKFLYATGLQYREVRVKENMEISYADTIILPLLSTETLEAVSVGNEYTRVDKTLRIAGFECTYDTLDVCVWPYGGRNPRNCGGCYKCVRTLLTLEVAGLADKYKSNFNIDAYKKNRLKQIIRSELRGDPFWKEIKDLAKSRRYRFPTDMSLALAFLRVPGVRWTIRGFWNLVRTVRGIPINMP